MPQANTAGTGAGVGQSVWILDASLLQMEVEMAVTPATPETLQVTHVLYAQASNANVSLHLLGLTIDLHRCISNHPTHKKK